MSGGAADDPMPRFTPPDPAGLDAAQRRVYDATRAGRRGTVPANVLAWLPSPELADRAQHLGAFLRYDTALGATQSELAILVVARHWSSQYEWAIHAVEAKRAGWSDEIVAEIAAGQTPALAAAEQAVFDVATELVTAGTLAEATFHRADAALGRRGLVELVALVGYYTLVAMTLNAFDVPAPDGAPRLP